MFDLLIKEVVSRFQLSEGKALSLVQLLLVYMTNKDTGGLAGFIDKFKSAGLGAVAQSWMAGDAANAQGISEAQAQQVLGGPAGLLRLLTSRFGINNQSGSAILAFVVPKLLTTLAARGGLSNSSTSQEVTAFIGDAKNWLASAAAGTTSAAAAKTVSPAPASNGVMKWLPFLVLAAAAAFLVSYCSKKPIVVEAASQAGATTKDTAGNGAAAAVSG